MLLLQPRKRTVFLVLLIVQVFSIIVIYHLGIFKLPIFTSLQKALWVLNRCEERTEVNQEKLKETEQEIKDIIRKLDQQIPRVPFTHMDNSTSAYKSRVTILNPKREYCIGDNLTVKLDMYDHLGRQKVYGGDFLRSRIYSPYLNAGASGKIEDVNNGTYLVHFTFFWAGEVQISILIFHPSEGVSVLWRARNQGFDKVYFTGCFTSAPKDVSTECGFSVNTSKEICKYQDAKDGEHFFCIKPDNVSCAAFSYLRSNNREHSYLNDLEKSLFVRSKVGVEIATSIGNINVLQCNKNNSTANVKCRTGMVFDFPSGFFFQNTWNPIFCKMSKFKAGEQINACLQGRKIHFMGDSTLRQWILYFPKLVKTLRFFDLHGKGKHKTLLAVDMDRNLKMEWKKHGHPYITVHLYSVKDDMYVTRQIDHLAGDNYTVVVISLGQHFRLFPIQVFIRRVINVRTAVERLFLRSPDTKVIIKSENIREMHLDAERFSDFHGYIQYRVMLDIFQGLNVGVIDAWDMTTALADNKAHPAENVIANQIDMFLTYIC